MILLQFEERSDHLIKDGVNYFVSLIDTESERDDRDIIHQVQDQESEILYHVLKATFQDVRNPTSSVPRDVLGVYILRKKKKTMALGRDVCFSPSRRGSSTSMPWADT
jgi:hypothetical protein